MYEDTGYQNRGPSNCGHGVMEAVDNSRSVDVAWIACGTAYSGRWARQSWFSYVGRLKMPEDTRANAVFPMIYVRRGPVNLNWLKHEVSAYKVPHRTSHRPVASTLKPRTEPNSTGSRCCGKCGPRNHRPEGDEDLIGRLLRTS